jgi:hypothetical protein
MGANDEMGFIGRWYNEWATRGAVRPLTPAEQERDRAIRAEAERQYQRRLERIGREQGYVPTMLPKDKPPPLSNGVPGRMPEQNDE